MAIPWITLLKTVPWTEVIAHAPTVANGAKKLWTSVSSRERSTEIQASETATRPTRQDDDMALIQSELDALQAATTELRAQMLASSELINELAAQNTALIQRVESYRIRLLWLSLALALVAALALASLALA